MNEIDKLLVDEKAEEKKEKAVDQIGICFARLFSDLIPPILTTLPLLWGYNTLSHFVSLPQVSYGEMLMLAWGIRTVGKLLRKG